MKLNRFNPRSLGVGAALVVLVLIAGTISASAISDTPSFSSVTTIQPCRLVDTRSAPSTVGPRSRQIGQGETYAVRAAGVAQGNCNLPANIKSVVLNVTAVNASAGSYLTIWPADKARPLASNLNFTATQGPTSNQVTTSLSSGGSLSIFNNAGAVDVIVDVSAYVTSSNPDERYYTKSQVDRKIAENPGPKGDTGSAGPQGDPGQKGDPGPAGADGAQGVDGVSGFEVVTATGEFTWEQITDSNGGLRLRGASCPAGKVLVNQALTWANRNDIYVWHATFPKVNSIDVDTTTQTPVFWITTDLNLANEIWDYTTKSFCITAN